MKKSVDKLVINKVCYFLLLSSDVDANNIFKAFFGGPGGFSFEGNSCKSSKFPDVI